MVHDLHRIVLVLSQQLNGTRAPQNGLKRYWAAANFTVFDKAGALAIAKFIHFTTEVHHDGYWLAAVGARAGDFFR